MQVAATKATQAKNMSLASVEIGGMDGLAQLIHTLKPKASNVGYGFRSQSLATS